MTHLNRFDDFCDFNDLGINQASVSRKKRGHKSLARGTVAIFPDVFSGRRFGGAGGSRIRTTEETAAASSSRTTSLRTTKAWVAVKPYRKRDTNIMARVHDDRDRQLASN